MICIGLTGGFGSGKSTVSRLFKQRGIPVISCDSIVGQLLRTKNIKKQIEESFGKQYFLEDGRVNRQKLAKLIFSSAESRKKLNGIIHPMVFKRIENALDRYRRKNTIAVVIEIPLLFETRSEKLFDIIITVSAPYEMIKKRLGKTYSISDIQMRRKSQMSPARKEEMADIVIDNSGLLKDTKKQVDEIVKNIIRRSSHG